MIVTHNMQQAQRVSDNCAFFLAGEGRAGTSDRDDPPTRCRLTRATPGQRTTCTEGSAEHGSDVSSDGSE